ncbi:MAG TPA: SURF1 family protein [Rhodanobacteraceae bacterium]|nr:SURF1 family protein [Rhodanobacteraceae bacterium]
MPATSRRWKRASWFAIALTAGGVLLFVRLGEWQLDRARGAQELLDAFGAAQHAPFEDFSAVAAAPPAARFPHVRVSGRFIAGRGYLRDEQVRDGKVGVEAIDAFAVDDGGAALLLVDRGWVAWTRSAGAGPALPALPDGEISLAGVYAPFPGSGMQVGGNALAAQKTWPKLTLALDPAAISADLDRPVQPRLLLLDPDAASGFVRTWTPAVMPPARHQAYAFQWFAFALASLILFVALHWKKVENRAS